MKRKSFKPTAHDIETEGLPSASGFDSEFRCHGKRALCAKLPKEEDTAHARRGQRIHGALQKGDFSELADAEQRTASRIAYGESEIVHEFGFEGARTTFEERVWDVADDLTPLWSGRVDRYDWQSEKRRLLVVDDKSGWTLPPPIHDNWQVRSEGALLADQFDAEETVVALIHPHHPDSLWEAKVYTRQEMRHLLDIVRRNVAEIQQPDQPRRYGAIQCQWCPAKRICPEYKAEMAALDQVIADEITDQGFTAILRQDANERGRFVGMIKERVKSLEYALTQYVELAVRDGEDSINGWRLRRKLTRSVLNEAEAMKLVRDKWGEHTLAAALEFNLVLLETELAAAGMTKKEAKALVEETLRPVLQFKRGKYFLEESRSL